SPTLAVSDSRSANLQGVSPQITPVETKARQAISDLPTHRSVGDITIPQQCTPDTSYKLPSSVDLSDKSEGLHIVQDRTSFYRVYGNTLDQIRQQMRTCAPATGGTDAQSEFAAETSYNLSSQYSWTADEAGVCHVSSVKVGLHINMVLPKWQSPVNADDSLTITWGNYTNHLRTHENGHAAIDKSYASKLLNDLKNFPSTDCSSIADKLKSKAKADISALDSANNVYDASTNHGATQGATF
ncbi:MAG TPA: DUF922 domain-containing protein, partial [Candidatus Saccharimonadales bacterium]|nr:DUF922 domain-containing protein [Candidatus Saccharimonadales bacterium]